VVLQDYGNDVGSRRGNLGDLAEVRVQVAAFFEFVHLFILHGKRTGARHTAFVTATVTATPADDNE
jgi:hypothetical protein